MQKWKEKIMLHCLALAKKGEGFVGNNPLVGAVLVSSQKKILSEGYHQGFGQKHAEVDALEKVSEAPEGSYLFINLEPCCHQGINPPCTKIILSKKIKKIIIGCLDPNPKVAGRGIQELEKNGVRVELGVCQKKCEELNEKYLTYRKEKRVFVALKIAASLDGKIALKNEKSQWITGEKARAQTHKIRSCFASIAVGKNTLLHDNPKLNNRVFKKMLQPSPVVFWGAGKLLEPCFFLQDTRKKFLAVGKNMPQEHLAKIQQPNLTIFQSAKARPAPQEVLQFLYKQKIFSLLIEGGSTLATCFLQAQLIDKIYLFLAPKILGSDAKNWCGALQLLNIPENCWEISQTINIGEDILLEIHPQKTYNKKQILQKK